MKAITLFLLLICSVTFGQNIQLGYYHNDSISYGNIYCSIYPSKEYVVFGEKITDDFYRLEYANVNLNQPITEKDTSLCQERGHIPGGYIVSTAAYCPPYFVDTDSTTVIIYPACNTESFTCKRCGKNVTQQEEERQVIIWKKP